MANAEGQLVAGRYRLERRVGNGGMGAVWQARDERLDRVVAIKQLTLDPTSSPADAEQARQRVFREARAAARLTHPHAVAVYDVADDGGQPVLVMEYLPSRSLAEVLAERGSLTPVETARIGAQVAAALAAAHAAGVLHRDVKPGNILLGEDGTTKISDFGIARASGDVTITRTGLLAGTPAYLSPEAARGHQPGPASDVFSLGATLYAAVEGAPPFGEADNPIAMLHTVAAGQVNPPHHAGPLTEPLMEMLRDDPSARPTMAEVRQRLDAIAAGQEPVATERFAPLTAPPQAATQRVATRLDLHPFDATEFGQPAAAGPVPGPPRRRIYLVLGVLSAGLLVLLLSTLLAASDQPSTATGSPPPPVSSSRPDAAALEQAVAGYYALLPDDTDQAWTRLGPGLQANGKRQFEQAWGDVKDLAMITPPRADGDTVVVEIEYDSDNRGRVWERHQLDMIVQNGPPLINSDRLLATVVRGDGGRGNSGKGKKTGKGDSGDG